jgi:fatty acid synthase, animal type
MIDDASKLAPIAGVFNLAAVLRDRIFDNQSVETFADVLKPKAEVTKYLDEISRKKCSNLKHFVVFSSVSCGRGNAGQSNYGMASSIAERIVEMRQQEGFPGKAIQWGVIGDVGMLAQAQVDNKNLEVAGTIPQEVASCLEVLDSLLTSVEPIVSSMNLPKKHSSKHTNKNVISDLLNILSVNTDKESAIEKPLGKFGIDSLMTVEIQQLLKQNYDTDFSANILRTLSIKQIQDRVDSVRPGEKYFDISSIDDFSFMYNTFGDDSTADLVIRKVNDIPHDGNLPVALIVPGIFGAGATAYTFVGKNLKYPTFILQLHKTAECTDFDEVIDLLKEDVLNLMTSKNFILICQSFGAPIGLKLAAFLETQGKVGHFVSVDGSHEWSLQVAKQVISSTDMSNLAETLTIKFFIKFAFIGEAKSVTRQVFTKKTWNERLEALYELVKPRFSFSFHYFKHLLLDAMINRTKMVLNIHDVHFPILKETRITLFRASEAMLKDFDEDYKLKRHSLQPFTNIVLEGSHVNIISHPKLTEFINEMYET